MEYFNNLLKKIKSNTSNGIINLQEYNIGDKEPKELGKALLHNDTVFYVQIPPKSATITDEGINSFGHDIVLRKTPLAVEANNFYLNREFRSIEENKRLGQEVKDKFANFLPTNVHNVQNDNSTGDLTDSSSMEDNAIQAPSVEENVVQEAPMEDNVVQEVSVVEEIVDKAEEAGEDLVELESITESVESLYVNDSDVNVVLENLNTSTPRNFVTIPSNNIKSEKIKSTGFFGKIFNGFKDTFTSLFNHNTTKVSNSTEDTVDDICVAKDYMLQEDTGVLGHANIDVDSD